MDEDLIVAFPTKPLKERWRLPGHFVRKKMPWKINSNRSPRLNGICVVILKMGEKLSINIYIFFIIIFRGKYYIPDEWRDAMMWVQFNCIHIVIYICCNSLYIFNLSVVLNRNILNWMFQHIASNMLQESQCNIRADRCTPWIIFLQGKLGEEPNEFLSILFHLTNAVIQSTGLVCWK